MPTCPQCEQSVAPDALTCPHCRLELKAHGHPGIPLHRATSNRYLCETCSYHLDDSCNFPQRPVAKTCTLYQDINAVASLPQSSAHLYRVAWWRRYLGWIALSALFAITLLIAVL